MKEDANRPTKDTGEPDGLPEVDIIRDAPQLTRGVSHISEIVAALKAEVAKVHTEREDKPMIEDLFLTKSSR